MNLFENIYRIKEMMGLTESFDKELKKSPDNNYNIEYKDGDKIVGGIRGGSYNNYLTVDHIYLSPEYRSKGHSLEFYKDALTLAKESGFEGLMVGGQLTTPHKSQSTYKHFDHHETEIKNQYGEPYVVLTNFIG